MALLLAPPEAHILDTGTAKGRGVFATRSFCTGELVEACPVVVIVGAFDALPKELQLLVFNWEVLAKVAGAHALALGFGSMYNHANPANMRYEAEPSRPVLRFIAVRDVSVGEELTINYNAFGGAPEWSDNNWFDQLDVKPVED